MTTFREFRERDPAAHQRPPALLPTGASSFQGERAGFVSRAVACGIDVLLVFTVVMLTVASLWLLSFLIEPTTPSVHFTSRIPPLAYLVAYGFFLGWLYWTVTWAASGRSIGDLVMGLRVVDRRGRHPRWGLSAVRAAFCIAFPIGLVWVVVSRSNRAVQDVVLRTSVIYDWVVGVPTLARVLGRVRAATPRP